QTDRKLGLAYRVQHPCRAQPGDFAGVLRHVEAHPNVALCSEVVQLVWLDLLDQLGDLAGAAEVPVVQEEPGADGVGVHVDMVNPVGVEGTRASHEPMNLVALGEQQFGKIRSVLACDSSDDCALRHGETKAYRVKWKASSVWDTAFQTSSSVICRMQFCSPRKQSG